MALTFGVSSISAQTVDDQKFDLIERAKMVAEITAGKEREAAKDKIIAEKDAQIDLYKKLDEKQEARISDLKEALASAGKTDTLVDLRESVHTEQTQFYKDEVERLRKENASLRKSRDRRGLIFGAIGIIAGKFIF